MEDLFALNREVVRSPSLARIANEPSPAEVAEEIIAALDTGTLFGLDHDLRHLAIQVARQSWLPRNDARDQRFFTHLEWRLRDLALRPAEPSSHPDRSRP